MKMSRIRQNGNSLVITIPNEIVQEFGLKENNFVAWGPDLNLTLCKVADNEVELRPTVELRPEELRPTVDASKGPQLPDAPSYMRNNPHHGTYFCGNLYENQVITVLTPNPKSGKSAKRYEWHTTGMTIKQYIDRCVKEGYPAAVARADIRWNIERKFISVE